MNSSIKIRKMVKIANPSSASMTRNSEIPPQKTRLPYIFLLPCLFPALLQLWWDTLYNPSATSMTRNLGFESLPFQKKQYLPYTYLFPLPCLFLCSKLWRNTLYCTHGMFLEWWNTKKSFRHLTTFFRSTWWGDCKNMQEIEILPWLSELPAR